MLTIKSNKLESVPFIYDVAGVEHELLMTQFTVADHFKLIELQKELFADGKADANATAKIIMSRIAVSVKDKEGKYFFADSLDKLVEDVPAEAIFALSVECDKLNPMNTGALEDKKK